MLGCASKKLTGRSAGTDHPGYFYRAVPVTDYAIYGTESAPPTHQRLDQRLALDRNIATKATTGYRPRERFEI